MEEIRTKTEGSRMKNHVTLVAALQIGFSAMGLIGAVILFFVFSFAGSVINGVDVDVEADIAKTVINFLRTFLPTLLLITSLIGLISGIGLLSYKRWARILTMAVAAIMCFAFPVGTIVGVYSLWVLMQDETTVLFR